MMMNQIVDSCKKKTPNWPTGPIVLLGNVIIQKPSWIHIELIDQKKFLNFLGSPLGPWDYYNALV